MTAFDDVQVVRCAGRPYRVLERPGQGTPVVLMAGCGLAMQYWRPLATLLVGRHLLAYDRPGIGGTDWGGRLPTLADEVTGLASLLDQRGISGALLVAHSMASFHAEALARWRPDLVAGIIMVDGSCEWPVEEPNTTWDQMPHAVRHALRVPTLSRVGAALWRLGTWVQSDWEYRHLGYGRLDATYRETESLVAATAESIAYYRQAWDLMGCRVSHPWPGVPTLVLTAGRDEKWLASQRRYADLLQGTQVVVESSKHLMMLDEPTILADVVNRMAPLPA